MFNPNEPLGLPPGSVRSIIAFAVVTGYFLGWVSTEIVTLVLGAYFVGRSSKSEA